jgi:hypothetical protein
MIRALPAGLKMRWMILTCLHNLTMRKLLLLGSFVLLCQTKRVSYYGALPVALFRTKLYYQY